MQPLAELGCAVSFVDPTALAHLATRSRGVSRDGLHLETYNCDSRVQGCISPDPVRFPAFGRTAG